MRKVSVAKIVLFFFCLTKKKRVEFGEFDVFDTFRLSAGGRGPCVLPAAGKKTSDKRAHCEAARRSSKRSAVVKHLLFPPKSKKKK